MRGRLVGDGTRGQRYRVLLRYPQYAIPKLSGIRRSVHSPGLIACGCVSCNGCPNCTSAADTKPLVPWRCMKAGRLLNVGTGREAARSDCKARLLMLSRMKQEQERLPAAWNREPFTSTRPQPDRAAPTLHYRCNFPISRWWYINHYMYIDSCTTSCMHWQQGKDMSLPGRSM